MLDVGKAVGFGLSSGVSPLLRAHGVSPKSFFTSWKSLPLDLTPEKAQRGGRQG